jgi:predicted dienelactone hydrolase
MYPTAQEKVAEQPVFRITRPKDLMTLEGPRPVIAWANGGCFRSDFTWQPLFDRWAGAGFVVLALTGSGSDDDIASMLDSTTDKHHTALVDWVMKANESGAYAGKLDLTRIVLAGNSCGGVTALQVAAKDKRAAAVFVLSGSSAIGSVDKQVMQAITIPVGYVTGSASEDVAAPNAADDYEAMRDGIPAMLVQRKTGDHLTVSTDEKVLPQDAEIALNWLDLALFGTKQAHETLTSPNVCEHCTPGDWSFKAKNLEMLIK